MSDRLEFSKRTKLEAYQRAKGRCEECGARLDAGNVDYHHKNECTMGGDNSPENCMAVCKTCHKRITGQRAPVIAKSNRLRARHLNLEKPHGRPMPGTKRSGWRKRMNGKVERRT